MSPVVAALYAKHTFLGLVALVSLVVSLSARKGGRLHRRAGQVNLFAMALVLLSAAGLAAHVLWRGPVVHQARAWALLLLVVLLAELLVFGMRVLKWRKPDHVRPGDRWLTRATGLAGLAGLLFSLLAEGGALLGALGFAGVLTAISHNRQQGDPPRAKARLAAHRGSLQAATLGVVTALGAVHWDTIMPPAPPKGERAPATSASGGGHPSDIDVRGAHEEPVRHDVDEPR